MTSRYNTNNTPSHLNSSGFNNNNNYNNNNNNNQSYSDSSYMNNNYRSSSASSTAQYQQQNDRSASQDGLTGVAAQLDAIHPMFKAMRDLEMRKSHEIVQLEQRCHDKDMEIMRLKRQVQELQQQVKNNIINNNNVGAFLSAVPPPTSQLQQQQLQHDRQRAAATMLGSALSPKQTSYPVHSGTIVAPSFFSSPSPVKSPLQSNNLNQSFNNNNSTSFATKMRLMDEEKYLKEREELEEMLSRSIARLAEAERALASERTRFLVVDPGLISMERWRAAVSRLADLHDEVAHRRFGACLAAARLSGQLPEDIPQMTATQYLRAALSPILLQMMANCFTKRKLEHEAVLEMSKHDDAFSFVDFSSSAASPRGGENHSTTQNVTATTTTIQDPWRQSEGKLMEEPDILLHHVNCILERLALDPGDDFVQ